MKYIRFGEIPDDEKSRIYRGEEEVGKENGVSVYPAIMDEGGNWCIGLSMPVTKQALHTFQALVEYSDRPCYLVEGDYVGRDSDNQPTIKNVKKLARLYYREKSDSLDVNVTDDFKKDEQIVPIKSPFYIEFLREVAVPETEQEKMEVLEREILRPMKLKEITEEEFKDIHMKRAFDIADAINGEEEDDPCKEDMPDCTIRESFRERYKRISKSEWFKRIHENLSVEGMKTPEESLGISTEEYNEMVDELLFGEKEKELSYPQSDQDEEQVIRGETNVKIYKMLCSSRSDQELTEFERAFDRLSFNYIKEPDLTNEGTVRDCKKYAKELLSIARKEFEANPKFLYTVTRRAAERARKEFIDEACRWLYQRQTQDLEVSDIKKFISDFRKHMEEQ